MKTLHCPRSRGTIPSFLAAFAVGVVGLSACEDDDGGRELETIQNKIALYRMSTCAEVETYIEDQIIEEVRIQFEEMKRGSSYGWAVDFDDALDGAPEAPSQGGNDGGSRGPDAYTDTNVREAGVDEADFVKTNGQRIFVVSGQKVFAATSWPPADLAVEDSIEIAGSPRDMFLVDDDTVAGDEKLVVFSDDWQMKEIEPGPVPGPGPTPDPGAPDIDCIEGDCRGDYYYWDTPETRITVIDASGATMQKLYELEVGGRYLTSRRIGDAVRIVVGEDIYRPAGLRMWPEDNVDWNDPVALAQALDLLLAQNIQIIRATTLAEFLPQSVQTDANGNEVILETDCARFHQPNAPVYLGLTTLATLNLGTGTMDRVSVFGATDTVYASTETLYMSSSHWWMRPETDHTTYTYIHAFDLGSSVSATYRGSFGVPGVLGVQGTQLGPYAMDEHAGHIRVATEVTEFRRSATDEWIPPAISNRITVFRKDAFGFTETGRTPDLAPDEQIFAVRMEGNRGFVVTFEQVDPLFTLDLSNPALPRIIGELKVPGFSTYLHFIDDDHLLAIGEHVPDFSFPNEPDEWGMKLSIFDVSNFAQPTELHTAYLGQGSSEAQWEPKAFNYFPQKKTLALPVGRWGDTRGGFSSGLELYEVDLVTGFNLHGTIDMTDVYPPADEWGGYYQAHVRRSVMADDYAYAISDAGIRVAPILTPTQTIATCQFR
jgi:hypothetical protein